nr:ribonuclease H-like domain-containing protein [Tanacetum cinerariifolium]
METLPTNEDGTSTSTILGPVTTEEKDAKTLFEAIQARFGGNDATKKTQKTLLKQMYENFNAPNTESLDSIFNRLQEIVSQLAILGENISQEDLNMKFLRSATVLIGLSVLTGAAALEELCLAILIEKLKKEKESNQIKIDNFENASKSLDKLIGSQITDDSKTGLGFTSYNVVAPPPTGLFSPLTIDLSSSSLEEFKQHEFESYRAKASKSVYIDTLNVIKKASDAPIIEDYVSDYDEDESEEMVVKSKNAQHKPEQVNQPRKVNQNPRNNITNWNEMRTQKLGVWFQFSKKACFMCGSFSHLIKDCDFLDKKMVQKPVLKTVEKGTGQREFVDQHNMVTYLEKSDDNIDFHQILDFLSSCSITYALTGIDTGGRPRRQETMRSTYAQTRSERVLEQPNEPPLTEGHTYGSGEGRLEENIKLTDTVPTPHDSPLTGGYTHGSDEGRITLAELMETCTTLSNRVTQLETELSTTKAIYNKSFITLTNRVKKLESQLKQKRSSAVIHSSDEKGPSVHIEDSPKQRRIIKDTGKDKNINLVSEQGEVQETTEHSRDDDDETLAETLLNIKRSSATDKGKGIIKLDQRKENVPKSDQAKEIDWNDPQVLRYHALQNRPFSKAKIKKNNIMYLKNQGGYKQSYFKGMKYEDIKTLFERIWDQVHTFVHKDSEIEREVMKRARFDLQQRSSNKQRLDQQTEEEAYRC